MFDVDNNWKIFAIYRELLMKKKPVVLRKVIKNTQKVKVSKVTKSVEKARVRLDTTNKWYLGGHKKQMDYHNLFPCR